MLNVTPDSFSDGGEWFGADAAVRRGLEMAAEGAAIIDVGGESTRPGAAPVPEGEELERTVPVVAQLARALHGTGTAVSIDTTKAAVARAALEAGATYVNDVSALRADPEMAAVIAEHGARCCLMHLRGEPRTMQDDPRYDDVVREVRDFLAERAAWAVAQGIPADRIDIDPGIGFGKTVEHNVALLARLDALMPLGHRVLVGVSRKSFLGTIAGVDDPRGRLPATIAANVLAYDRGARAFRVHDVAAHAQALAVAARVTARA